MRECVFYNAKRSNLVQQSKTNKNELNEAFLKQIDYRRTYKVVLIGISYVNYLFSSIWQRFPNARNVSVVSQ